MSRLPDPNVHRHRIVLVTTDFLGRDVKRDLIQTWACVANVSGFLAWHLVRSEPPPAGMKAANPFLELRAST